MFYKETVKEKSNFTLTASLVSTVLISINLMSVYFLLEYLDVFPFIPNKYYIITFMIIVWVFNYYGIVRKEEFLKFNFIKDKKGGWLIVLYFIISISFSIFIGNLKREKIFNSKKLQKKEQNLKIDYRFFW